MTGSTDDRGSPSAEASPDHRPTKTHKKKTHLCTQCEKNARLRGQWCVECHEKGKAAARASGARQMAAGMPVPWKNWKPGDPHWWKASGCYGDP